MDAARPLVGTTQYFVPVRIQARRIGEDRRRSRGIKHRMPHRTISVSRLRFALLKEIDRFQMRIVENRADDYFGGVVAGPTSLSEPDTLNNFSRVKIVRSLFTDGFD